MVERVAKAMWEQRRLNAMNSHGVEFQGWDSIGPNLRNDILSESRAVIEAMREPTEAMIDAVPPDQATTRGEIEAIWSYMIDAALGTPE